MLGFLTPDLTDLKLIANSRSALGMTRERGEGGKVLYAMRTARRSVGPVQIGFCLRSLTVKKKIGLCVR